MSYATPLLDKHGQLVRRSYARAGSQGKQKNGPYSSHAWHLKFPDRVDGHQKENDVESHARAVQGNGLQIIPLIALAFLGGSLQEHPHGGEGSADEDGDDGVNDDIDCCECQEYANNPACGRIDNAENSIVQEEDRDANRAGHGGVEKRGSCQAFIPYLELAIGDLPKWLPYSTVQITIDAHDAVPNVQ
jgi:hypothetical protein